MNEKCEMQIEHISRHYLIQMLTKNFFFRQIAYQNSCDSRKINIMHPSILKPK